MSVDSYSPSVMVDSSHSLIHHSNVSIDSLVHSGDDFFFDDDDIRMTSIGPDNLSNSLEVMINECRENPAEKHTETDKETKTNEKCSKDSLENSLSDEQKRDFNGNNEKYEYAKVNTQNSTDHSQRQKKSRIPKSRTFDSQKSPYHSRCVEDNFADDNMSNLSTSTSTISTNRTGTGLESRNHMFLTSQECMLVPGCSLPRDTIASRLRYEKQLSGEFSDGPYKTPSQRKDVLIRDLRRQIREFKVLCEEKDREINMYRTNIDDKTSKIVEKKDAEISKLREEMNKLQRNYDDISNFCEESVAAASILEEKTEHLKVNDSQAMDDREKQHQKIYLEMYKKGKDCARIEREEELEVLAAEGQCSTMTISELVRKLAWTELELAKWQTLKRQESYNDAVAPESESYATLRFLKDSFFHYITDEKDSDHHMRAIIKIFKYTEPQMNKIRASKIVIELEKRYKKKSKRK
ncbi:uncharacterized protein LOC128205249 isoform X2 [Mya arenaria]|uniref:uncharacterized protein LOC128205249 isoform X2 n=1 Tax=Mya arenaria TaxID=6604 RepID=UPI0022E02BCF|nr:uncharacterized protein LOC128205249 isoform X2 [Mya arenaria]